MECQWKINVHITLSFQHLKEKHIMLQEEAPWWDDLLCRIAQSCDSCLVSFTLKNWETVSKIWDSTEANKFRQTLALAPHNVAYFLVTFVLIRGSLCKYLCH